MYRFKVEIVIDEEKVIKDDKYEPEVMYDFIRKMFKQFELPEIKTEEPYHLIFTDNGRNKDMGGLTSAAIDLYEMDWFKKYAIGFYWYSRNSDNTISKSSIFDELNNFKVKGIWVWKQLMIFVEKL